MICLYIILTHQRGNFSVQITNFSSNRFDILGGKKKIEKEDYYILELNLNLLCSSDAKKIKKECAPIFHLCNCSKKGTLFLGYHYFKVVYPSFIDQGMFELCTHLPKIHPIW